MTQPPIHHPSCPARHAHVACLCGPEATAEDLLILQHRSPDAMVLDVIAHADQAMLDRLRAGLR